jgi:hypothetical protein
MRFRHKSVSFDGKKKISDEFFLSSSLKKSNRAAVKLSRRGEMRSEAREREKRDVRDDPRHHRRRVSKKKRRKRSARALRGREREKREKREKEKRTSGTIDEHLNRSSRPEIGFHHVLQTFRGVDVHEQRRGFVHGLGVWVHRAQRGGHFFLFYVFLILLEREREREMSRVVGRGV